jgi:hypothetical protein
MHATLEEHLSVICPGCKKEHNKQWSDQFDKHQHYSRLTCDCNYEIFIRSKHFTSSVNH